MRIIITVLRSGAYWLLALGLLELLAMTALGAEEPTAELKAQALKAFERGTGYYQKDDFDKAIEQWEAGYRLVPKPVFLYNIGQAHRLSKRSDKALDYYRRYLHDSPDAKNRSEVEERITLLEAELAASRKQPELFVPPPLPGPEGSEPKPSSLLGAGDDELAAAQAQQRRKRLLPILLGAVGGAVVLGVALGVGIYFGTRSPTPAVFTAVAP